MVFSSLTFLIFFLPLFLFCYFIVSDKFKNVLILAFSLFFYAWGAPKFVFLLLGSTILDFYLVQWMHAESTPSTKRYKLWLSLLLNLGLLAFFKYANFFIDNVNALLNLGHLETITWVDIALPIGISFYTFQTLTYSIDVYRGKQQPLDKLSDYLLYIIMFPQMIAGPIVRYEEIADQIRHRVHSYEDRLEGFYRFIIGLSKKVLLANVLGEQADRIMGLADYSGMDSGTAWIGLLAYSLQIYFDFSGYSDMAIGIGRMLGFRFPENFDNPYVSKSITEFWKRWHMTLGRWMRDYLYIPLGGNQVSSARLYMNLWIVFILSGLWHGASWGFVLWGVYHGTFLVLDRKWTLRWSESLGNFLPVILTFIIVSLGWVLFRIESLSGAMSYYKVMFSFSGGAMDFLWDKKFVFILVLALFFAFFTMIPKIGQPMHDKIYLRSQKLSDSFLVFVPHLLLLLLCIISLTAEGYNPFVYFRF